MPCHAAAHARMWRCPSARHNALLQRSRPSVSHVIVAAAAALAGLLNYPWHRDAAVDSLAATRRPGGRALMPHREIVYRPPRQWL